VNKVEWCVLDFGGYDIYKSLYSIFFSGINHAAEPTVFVCVYNHSDYTSERHAKYIGTWVEYILMHNKTSKGTQIRIKLIGLVKSAAEVTAAAANGEGEAKLNLVLEKTRATIKAVRDTLVAEKDRLGFEPKSKRLHMNDAEGLLDALIERDVLLYEEISLIDSACKRESVEAVLSSLETLSIALGKVRGKHLNLLL
jgi:hypothetical protein